MNQEFNNFKFPHIKYISQIQSKPESERTLYYIGGEPDENHSRLTVGKQYIVRTAYYSESPDIERSSVWVCSGDLPNGDNKDGKILRIDLKNFITFVELRDRKIDNILK
jgi:hypothetical protein